VDGFSHKNESHNFDYHNFSDVKYLYFLCLEIYSFWFHLGPILGLEPIEETLAHVNHTHQNQNNTWTGQHAIQLSQQQLKHHKHQDIFHAAS
jgi:hypothetical protein